MSLEHTSVKLNTAGRAKKETAKAKDGCDSMEK